MTELNLIIVSIAVKNQIGGMSMLIRSQDKKTLVNLENTNAIRIYEGNTGFTIDAWGVSIDYEIGEYSTEEKAIKVLDMIQEEYLYCERCKERGEEAGNIPCYVLQMPQDSEV